MENNKKIYVVMKGEMPLTGFYNLADAEELCADLMFDACYTEFYCTLQTGIPRWRCSFDDGALMLALSDARHAGYFYRIMQVDMEDHPVTHAKWIKNEEMRRCNGHIYDYCCSHCRGFAGRGVYNNYDIKTPYCPHCGAKMDGQ